MFVSCPAARFHATSRTKCIYVYAYMHAICTRYVCGSAGTSLSRQRALPRTVCMRQRGHFQSFTHYMHAAARALSLFHSSTLKAARRHLGMSVCRRRRSAGLQRVSLLGLRSSLLEFALSRGSLSGGPCLRSCGPAALRPCGCGLCCHAVSDLSCCQRCMRTTWHGSAPPVSRCHARGGAGGAGFSLCSSVAGGAGGLAMEAWRWRLGAGGLALEASWPVAVRRRALGAVPPVLVALGAAWLGVACGVVSAGFGCRGPKKRRRADTEDEDTRGRPAAGSAKWRHVLVRLHTRFVRCALLEHKPPELA